MAPQMMEDASKAGERLKSKKAPQRLEASQSLEGASEAEGRLRR